MPVEAINKKAFAASVAILGGLWLTFSMGKKQDAGHRIFDSNKPEAVTQLEEKRRQER
jgi:hypothetical protein